MPGPVELGYLAGAAGHHPETLISGQRLDGRKASVFARLEECEPRPGMQLITRRADALRETRARRAAVVLAEAGGGLEQLGMVVPSGAGPGGGDAIVTRLTKVTRGAAHGSGGQAGQAAGLGDSAAIPSSPSTGRVSPGPATATGWCSGPTGRGWSAR